MNGPLSFLGNSREARKENRMLPAMTTREISAINSLLRPSDTMLEWGGGGSTVSFCGRVQSYFSIEHDVTWYAKVCAEIVQLGITNINIVRVPPEYPHEGLTPAKPGQFDSYSSYAGKFGVQFDKVLVDGRDRKNCAINVLPFLKDDGIVLFHDFIQDRMDRYAGVLDFYTIVDRVDSLVILRRTLHNTKHLTDDSHVVN